MKPQTITTLVLFSISIFIFQNPSSSSSSSSSSSLHNNFIQCLTQNSPPQIPISTILSSPTNPSYNSLLKSSIQNLRFSSKTTPKPLFIVTPLLTSHVQATILCSKQYQLNLRTLSGGHDYEGLSYTTTAITNLPFFVLDLLNFRTINVNIAENSAWVESGASVGELYYRIAEKSRVRGFPAGICPTVGVGGHFGGGGFGTMLRKHGLAADNIVDARVVDARGRVLDRESMGEDLFWAIRGGGGSSFCVVLAWKVKLVHVPPIVTVFDLEKRLGQHATRLVHKWQFVSPRFDDRLFVRSIVEDFGNQVNKRTLTQLKVRFNSMFLGRASELVEMLGKEFPELGLKESDCSEMSWIESIMYFSGYPKGSKIEALIDRTPQPKGFFKAKSDYVKKPLSVAELGRLWEWCLEDEKAVLIMDPYGGKMDDIEESQIPFPHRKGNLYNIQYYIKWQDGKSVESTKRHMAWIRRVYEHMTPYVSANPRGAYLNYRDLDLGVNDLINGTSYSQAQKWGLKYFKGNFKRLAIVKGQVDPLNFFRDEQSVPPLVFDVGMREIE